MQKIRLAFCGAGSMGQSAHLFNYAQLGDQCEIVAVSDLIPTKAAKVAAKYGIPNAYESHTELLRRHGAEIDAIVAICPFVLHGSFLPEIIAAGKPFLIEKPWASSIAVGEQLLARLEAANGRCMIAYHKRSDPATSWAKAEIDRLKASGELGAMRLVKLIMPPGDWIAGAFGDLVTAPAAGDFPAMQPDAPDPRYAPESHEAYLTFVNYYIHQVNLMRYLLGEDYRFEYVTANAALAAGVSDSGVACALEMAPYTATIDWNEEAVVCFERGYVRIQLPAPLALNRPGQVTVFRDPGNGTTPMTSTPTLPPVHAMRQQAINFLKFVRGEAPAPSDAAEGLLDLQRAREYLDLVLQGGKGN